jgi:carbon starvation protein
MLTEGFLATLVILACGAGLGLGVATAGGETLIGEAAWAERYASWGAAKGLGAKVGAFVDGSANFLMALGLSGGVAVALMGVLVASFAGTTLDTACRLQRYVVQELAATLGGKLGEKEVSPAAPFALLQNKHGATIFAVVIATAMAAIPQGGAEWSLANAGKGGLTLWPLFGATNQLLAGLSFMVITFYLWRRGRAIWFLAIPMIFMLVMPMWAMLHQLFVSPGWLKAGQANYLLGGIGLVTIALEIWMIIEALKLFPAAKGVLEENALDQSPEGEPAEA